MDAPGAHTHFGYKTVEAQEKAGLVGAVFTSVAGRYDLMNDLMSAGLHRLWKDRFVALVPAHASAAILDLAGGTGDIAQRLRSRTGASVTVCDINPAMLNAGRDRQIDRGRERGLRWVCGDAQRLPVPPRSQDVITIAFGLRNVTDIDAALREAYASLRPGGQFLCLEFSKPLLPWLAAFYDRYSFHVIPRIGEWVAGDRASYQYLVESIRMFPDQEALASRMRDVGFARVRVRNLSGGIVAIHQGWRV